MSKDVSFVVCSKKWFISRGYKVMIGKWQPSQICHLAFPPNLRKAPKLTLVWSKNITVTVRNAIFLYLTLVFICWENFAFYAMNTGTVPFHLYLTCAISSSSKEPQNALFWVNGLSIGNHIKHYESKEHTLPPLPCFMYWRESECVCNLAIVLRIQQITLDTFRNTCIITFTCSIHEFVHRALWLFVAGK